jgi:parallel beta-helix repeat protein
MSVKTNRWLGIGALFVMIAAAMTGAVIWQYRSITGAISHQATEDPRIEKELAFFQQLADAKALVDEGQFAEALRQSEVVKTKTTLESYRWSAELVAAHARRGLGQFEEADRIYQRILNGPEDHFRTGSARIGISELYMAQGKIDEAIRELEDIIETYEAKGAADVCGLALLSLAGVYHEQDQLVPMRAALARIVEDFPGSENSDAGRADRYLDRVSKKLESQQITLIEDVLRQGAHHIEAIPAGKTTTLKRDEKPYVIDEMLSVTEGSILEIEPGAVIRFGVRGGIVVHGRLVASGSSDAPIRLESVASGDGAAWWRGLQFDHAVTTEPSILEHVDIVAAESGVDVTRGAVRLANCKLTQPVKYGLRAARDGQIVANATQITGGAFEGVRCEEGGTLTLDGGRVADQAMTGIRIVLSKDVTISRVVIENNRAYGIFFSDASGGRVDACKINGNHRVGLVSHGGSHPTVANCEIRGNRAEGVACVSRGQAVINRSRIMNNVGGVYFVKGSDATLSLSEVRDNERYGIRCELANPLITQCVVSDNQVTGILNMNGQPKLDHNNLDGNQGPALRNQSSNVIDAGHNWWGSADPVEIAKTIEDGHDDGKLGKVTFDPPLTEAPVQGA